MEQFKPFRGPKSIAEEQNFKLLEARYGDGYGRTIADGLRPWEITHTALWEGLTLEQEATLRAFFNKTAGKIWAWPNFPTGGKKFFRTLKLSAPKAGRHSSLSVTLREEHRVKV